MQERFFGFWIYKNEFWIFKYIGFAEMILESEKQITGFIKRIVAYLNI